MSTSNSDNQFFKSLISFSSDNFDIVDSKGNFIFSGEKSILTSTLQQNKEVNIFDILHVNDIDNFKNKFQQCIKSPGVKIEFQCKTSPEYQNIQFEGFITNQLLKDEIKGILIVSRLETSLVDNNMVGGDFKKYQQFLSETALNFLELSNKTDIYAYIGKRLKSLLHEAVFFVHSYLPNSNKLKIEYSYGLTKEGQALMQQYVKNPNYLSGRFNKKNLSTITSGKLFYLRNGISDLSLRAFTRELIEKFENELKLNTTYIIGINRKSVLYGIITILNTSKINLDLFNVIETFVYQAAIAIHRKELEEALIIEKKKVEEADRLKSIFLANISHEIRTPMNGIIGFSQLLQDETLSPEKKLNFINIIEKNGQILMSLINNIIDISKIESGQLKLDYEEINVNQFFDELYTWTVNEKKLRRLNNIEINKVVSLTDESCILFTDKTRLNQIFQNLIENAFKCTETGVIELGYHLVADENGIYDDLYQFYVKDTGVGISRADQKIIFDSFRQADDGEKKLGGTGLGLTITKNLIELMGGKIWVNSKVNEGSTFTFTIPHLDSINQLKKVELTSIMSDELSLSDNKNILIVDQDETNVLLLKELIELENANYYVCNNGLQTLNILNSANDIDLVLLEIKLPYTDGFGLIEKIKKINPKLPVIVQTADILSESQHKAFDLGCDEYLTKPIQKIYLNKYIDKYLG